LNSSTSSLLSNPSSIVWTYLSILTLYLSEISSFKNAYRGVILLAFILVMVKINYLENGFGANYLKDLGTSVLRSIFKKLSIF